jgi:thiol-disulfide isomerase/thioredoxin
VFYISAHSHGMKSQRIRFSSARTRVILLIFAPVAIAVFIWRGPIQAAFLSWLVLRSESPSEEVLAELAAGGEGKFLRNLWSTGKIPHRQFVLQQIKDKLAMTGRLDSEQSQLLLESVADGDCSNREGALGVLASQKSSYLASAVLRNLEDPDPELRLFAMRYMRFLPAAPAISIKLLDDRDPRVVAIAGTTLRTLTSQDFGLRLSKVINGDLLEQRALSEEELKSMTVAVQNTKAWWESHKRDYASLDPGPVLPKPLRPPAISDFSLTDLDGRSVSLSQFTGKSVLINFWATWCTACLGEIQVLLEFQRRHPEVTVIGIALDGVREDHDNPDQPPPKKSDQELQQIVKKIRRTIEANGLTYKVLLDPNGIIAARFNGGELPTNVLLDKEHSIQRRFVGARSVSVLESMLAEPAR